MHVGHDWLKRYRSDKDRPEQARKYLAEAREAFEKAERLDPSLPSAQFGLALIEHYEGRLERALSRVATAIRLGESPAGRRPNWPYIGASEPTSPFSWALPARGSARPPDGRPPRSSTEPPWPIPRWLAAWPARPMPRTSARGTDSYIEFYAAAATVGLGDFQEHMDDHDRAALLFREALTLIDRAPHREDFKEQAKKFQDDIRRHLEVAESVIKSARPDRPARVPEADPAGALVNPPPAPR